MSFPSLATAASSAPAPVPAGLPSLRARLASSPRLAWKSACKRRLASIPLPLAPPLVFYAST